MPSTCVISTPYSLGYLLQGNHLLPGDQLIYNKVERYYLDQSIDTYFIINPTVQFYIVGGTKEELTIDLPLETVVVRVNRREEDCNGN